jgi:hypothetical protein
MGGRVEAGVDRIIGAVLPIIGPGKPASRAVAIDGRSEIERREGLARIVVACRRGGDGREADKQDDAETGEFSQVHSNSSRRTGERKLDRAC